MDHEEITTKIEITPPKTDNIVHINFTAKREPQPQKPTPQRRASDKPAAAPEKLISTVKSIDLSSPWVFRLIAVLTILILSMLVL